MKSRSVASVLIVAAGMAGFAAGPVRAQGPDHPHYLHALSDLRTARALLNRPAEGNVMADQGAAMEEINHAIGEIRRASIDDGRDPNFQPPVDPTLDYQGRLRKARELVEEARGDLGFEEDNMVALGWRQAAIHHVEEAQRSISHAIQDKRIDKRMGE